MKVKAYTVGRMKMTLKSLQEYKTLKPEKILTKLGLWTVTELKDKSPVRTGEFQNGWYYTLEDKGDKHVMYIANSSHPDVPDLAWYLEYGHMANGHYIEGRHFIIPTIDKLYAKIRELTEDELNGK